MKELRKKIFIREAVKVLKKNITQIRTVKDWAKMMHSSRSSFYSKFDRYKYSPKVILKQIRYKNIIYQIKENPQATSSEIAVKVGLNNSKSVYKFLHSHFDTTFTELRSKILKRNLVDQEIHIIETN